MAQKTELLQLTADLKSRGVRRVSLCFSPRVSAMPRAQAVKGVQDFLQAYLDGRFRALDCLGDAPGLPSTL